MDGRASPAWSARHRWPVFGLWFVTTIGLFAASLAPGGTRTVEAVSNDQRAKYEAGEAYVLYSEANASAGQQAARVAAVPAARVEPGKTVDDPGVQPRTSPTSPRGWPL